MGRVSVSEALHPSVTSSSYPTPKAPAPNQPLPLCLSRHSPTPLFTVVLRVAEARNKESGGVSSGIPS